MYLKSFITKCRQRHSKISKNSSIQLHVIIIHIHYQTVNTSTYISGTDIYPHMPTFVHTPRDFMNGASIAWRLRQCIYTVMFTCGWAWPARSPIVWF